MSLSMYIVGFVIFAIYMGILIWNIYNGHKVEEREKPIDHEADELDMDGMGNFSRFPTKKQN